MSSNYRPTAAYQASVVLIESNQSAHSPLPVLTRGPRVRDPATLVEREGGVLVQAGMLSPIPEVTSIEMPDSRLVAWLGDEIALHGFNLDGAEHALLLQNTRLRVEFELAPTESVTPTIARFELPDDPATIPAGSYIAQLRLVKEVIPGTGPSQRLSNAFPLSIAPQITAFPTTATLDADGDLTLTPTCTPLVRPTQHVSLILGGSEAPAEPFTAVTDAPSFIFRDLPAGMYWVRLRVDGIDTPLINRAVSPPAFMGRQIEVRL